MYYVDLWFYICIDFCILSFQVFKKTAKQVMLTEVVSKDLEFDYSSLQSILGERVTETSSVAKATVSALIPLGDGFVLHILLFIYEIRLKKPRSEILVTLFLTWIVKVISNLAYNY